MTSASTSGPLTQPMLVLLLVSAAAEVVEVVVVVTMEHDRDNANDLASSTAEQNNSAELDTGQFF